MLAPQKHTALKTWGKVLASLLLVGPLACLSQAGQYYKWVDINGITHFSEKPIPGTEAKKMGTSSKTEEAPAADTPATSTEAPANAAPAAAAQASNEENCKIAQDRIKALQSGQRIRLVGSDGKFSYLDENQIKEEIQKTQEVLKSSCVKTAPAP